MSRPTPRLLSQSTTDEVVHLLRGCVETLRGRGESRLALQVLGEEETELSLAVGFSRRAQGGKGVGGEAATGSVVRLRTTAPRSPFAAHDAPAPNGAA